MAVGRNETRPANNNVKNRAAGRLRYDKKDGLDATRHSPLVTRLVAPLRHPPSRRSRGTNRITHGNSSGRLLALAPVKSAAASREWHKSVPRLDTQARHAKSSAASA